MKVDVTSSISKSQYKFNLKKNKKILLIYLDSSRCGGPAVISACCTLKSIGVKGKGSYKWFHPLGPSVSVLACEGSMY